MEESCRARNEPKITRFPTSLSLSTHQRSKGPLRTVSQAASLSTTAIFFGPATEPFQNESVRSPNWSETVTSAFIRKLCTAQRTSLYTDRNFQALRVLLNGQHLGSEVPPGDLRLSKGSSRPTRIFKLGHQRLIPQCLRVPVYHRPTLPDLQRNSER